MSGAPVTLVVGFGRCGSSLTMQMLAAGGMPMVGRFPAFEDDRAKPLYDANNPALWLADCAGHAVKLLDPQRFDIPPGHYRVFWCHRDPIEQARSQAKFAEMMLGLPRNRRMVRALAQSYVDDRPAAMKALARGGCREFINIAFEDTLATPLAIARAIAAHCIHQPLDVERMAAAVRPRDPRCAPGLDMELALVEGR